MTITRQELGLIKIYPQMVDQIILSVTENSGWLSM